VKDRIITLLGALVALYILARLLFPQLGMPVREISFPTSQNQGEYGLAGLDRWLQGNGVATYSLRTRYDSLHGNPALAKHGNLMLISLPLRLDAQASELMDLKAWVEDGNNVLFLVAMSDWPEWANRSMSNSVAKELENFGLEMVSERKKNTNQAPAPGKDKSGSGFGILAGEKAVIHKRYLYPALEHPLTTGIEKVQADWLSSEGIRWHLDSLHGEHSSLILLRDKANNEPALWLSFFGKGTIVISRHSDLFGNVSLGLADNAALFSNLVHNLLGKKGKLVFDDMHQGLSVLYDPNAFFHDPRLHHTLLFMLAFWLVYVIGHSNRFGLAREKHHVVQLLEHVKAIGNLFARRLHSSAVAIRYAQHFFNEVRANYGLAQNGQPVWEELSRLSSVDALIVEQAQSLYRMALARHKIDLIVFTNTLKTIRRKL